VGWMPLAAFVVLWLFWDWPRAKPGEPQMADS
jgi:hypothetical protein